MEDGQTTVEVTTAELRQILADHTAYVFDARSYLEYAISHIPGSLTAAPRMGRTVAPVSTAVSAIECIVEHKAVPLVLYCNGPFCEDSKRLAQKLLDVGFTNVRRYQLGIPTWRALAGLTQIELDGARYIFDSDKTAVWIDTRRLEEFAARTLPGSVCLPSKAAVIQAKADRQPFMQDHSTRIIVFGRDGTQAHVVARELIKHAFHNVSYFGGSFEELWQGLQSGSIPTTDSF